MHDFESVRDVIIGVFCPSKKVPSANFVGGGGKLLLYRIHRFTHQICFYIFIWWVNIQIIWYGILVPRFTDYFHGQWYISRVKLHSWVLDSDSTWINYFIAWEWRYIYDAGKRGWCFQRKVVGWSHNLNILNNDTEGVDEEDSIMNEVQVDKFKVNNHVLEDEMFNTELFIDVPKCCN